VANAIRDSWQRPRTTSRGRFYAKLLDLDHHPFLNLHFELTFPSQYKTWHQNLSFRDLTLLSPIQSRSCLSTTFVDDLASCRVFLFLFIFLFSVFVSFRLFHIEDNVSDKCGGRFCVLHIYFVFARVSFRSNFLFLHDFLFLIFVFLGLDFCVVRVFACKPHSWSSWYLSQLSKCIWCLTILIHLFLTWKPLCNMLNETNSCLSW